MLKYLLFIFFILLCEQAHTQDRFIVYVSEFMSGNLGGANVRCPGTIFTDRHVLTTAACAIPTNSSLRLAIDLRLSGGSVKVPAERAFIHPNYTGDVHFNNVAVVLLEGQFNSSMLPPRNLGTLLTNSTCKLFGWGGALDIPETVDIEVNGPQYCNSSRPQAYCSEHSSPTRACEALTGSPIVCNNQSVDGILLERGCIEASPGRFILAYHSVFEFKEWIEVVSGVEVCSKISIMLLLVVVMVICLKNVV